MGLFFEKFKKKKKADPDFVGYTDKVRGYPDRDSLRYLLQWFKIDRKHKIVTCKDDSVFSVMEFRGPDMDSSTQNDLLGYMAYLNNIIRRLGTGYVLYFDAVRHVADRYDHSRVDNKLVQLMDDERADFYTSSSHFETSFYLTVYHEPPQRMKEKLTDAFYEDAKDETGKNSLKIYEEFLRKFVEVRTRIFNLLKKVMPDIHILDEDQVCTYLHNMVSPHRHGVKYWPEMELSDYLFDGEGLTGGHEIRVGDKWASIVSPLSFPPESYPAFLDELNSLNFEYHWTSRYICLSKADAKQEIENKSKFYAQSAKSLWAIVRDTITGIQSDEDVDESALANAEDANTALMELESDAVSFGYYSLSILVMDKDREKCKEKAEKVLEALHNKNFSAMIETVNALEAWFGRLPGHYRSNIRRVPLSSLTFCHFIPVTAIWPGDERNSFLNGPALLYTDTVGYTPFRLNLHVGDVGHTMIVGPSGAGKSVLLNTLEAHMLKYKDSRVFIFDKSASSRALTLAVGGNFYNLAAENSNELSFQPLARIDNENEARWAKSWILDYLRMKNVKVTPKEDNFVWQAILSLQKLEPGLRNISNFCDLVQDQGIRLALVPLTMKGSYGRLFDNTKDVSGTGRWQVFEMETLMGQPEAVPPTLDYLFHRIEDLIREAKGPSIIVLDECWLFLSNDAFANKLREYFKDMRKKNCSIIIATQNLSDIAQKPALLDVVKEQCLSKIYLPNVNAMTGSAMKLYEEFGLNEQQIGIVRSMTPKQDYYYSSQKGNRIFQLALRPSELPFVTATSKQDQQAIDRILLDEPGIYQGDRETFIRKWFEYKDCIPEWEKYAGLQPV
jgi:type IV secretion system protein VirB4